ATGQTIIGATILLTSKSDTIRTITNADGIFVIKNVKQATFVITTTSVGYQPSTKRYLNNDVAKRVILDPVVLKEDSHQLNQVNVNGTPSIVYKTDTIEYRASDYKVRENSTVDELLKHMEGFEVGSDGSVTHQGQAVTKARLNGKDYAGGNIAQAIQNLPADIIEKVQVVDDYGDQAGRTGIKDGDPTKVLNLTTKADKSVGNIARITASDGSDDRYNERLFLQRINGNQQISLIGNLTNSINGVASTGANAGAGGSGGNASVSSSAGGSGGTTTSGSPSLSYRDQVSKSLQINANYRYTFNDVFSINNSTGQNFNQSGSTAFTKNTTGHNNNNTHNASVEFEFTPDSSNFVRITPTFSYNGTTTDQNQQYNQMGLINQDLSGHSTSSNTTPNYGVVALYQYIFKKDHRRNISFQYTLSNSNQQQNTGQNQHIIYKDSLGNTVKDSLVNRTVNRTNFNKSDRLSLTYVEPLTKISQLEFNEQYIYRGYDNTAITSNINPATGAASVVDSLSNVYKYSFSQGNFAVNYRLNKTKYSISIGARSIVTHLAGDNISKGTTTNRNDFYIIPLFRFQYQWSRTNQLSINYAGTPTEPSFTQIQPLPDFSDPQNPVYGNPNLKPMFSHVITTRYNDYIANSKFNFSLNTRTTFYQDQIVTNNVLVAIPLLNSNGQPALDKNGKPQSNLVNDVHYLNANGAFGESITYNIAKQLNDRAYNLEFNGTVNYGYNVAYSNNIRNHITTWEVNERFGPRITPNTSLEINPFVSYDDNRSFTTIPSPGVQSSTDIKTTALNLEGKFYFLKDRTFAFEYNLSKNYIQGIASNISKNPFVANAYLEKEFFKRKNGILRVSAFDIFNQNNFINRVVTANSITDTKTNALSRYVLVSFVLNLQKFSGTPSRGGKPMQRRGDGSFIVN
ncbi:MAG: hypothetical protein JWQ06_822, partial [Mucilaginibacter sp.]|nr:hypothetical protein [Mucilaginibacter sp.]